MTDLAIPPHAPAPPQPTLHPRALPPATRARQLTRHAVQRATEAVEAAEHAEALAALATRRARLALAHWRERLEAAEREAT